MARAKSRKVIDVMVEEVMAAMEANLEMEKYSPEEKLKFWGKLSTATGAREMDLEEELIDHDEPDTEEE